MSAPLPYCRVILALGNGSELQGDIQGILPSGSVMAVKVTAATSKGRELADDEWRRVVEACEMMFGLDRVKRDILDYVESRISLLAPNISAIVGTQTATKILGIAGGLAGLNRIPHSNIYVLGANKRPSSTGFSTASYSVDRLHTGFIYQCPLVQQTRPEDRMKAQRKVGAKVALAARVDFAGSSPRGEFGDLQRDKLEREMERLARPPPKKVTKALPRPDEKKKNRRGGKRARKAKDAYGMTELRKQQNRVKFGEAEEEVGAFDETRGMGMVGSSSGHVRANVGESRSKGSLFSYLEREQRADLEGHTQRNCRNRQRVESLRSRHRVRRLRDWQLLSRSLLSKVRKHTSTRFLLATDKRKPPQVSSWSILRNCVPKSTTRTRNGSRTELSRTCAREKGLGNLQSRSSRAGR